jgi:hypothetical protein
VVLAAVARGGSGELRLGEEVVMPEARPGSGGASGPVVDFHNGSGESDAEITAEAADEGHSEPSSTRVGPVSLSCPALWWIYNT